MRVKNFLQTLVTMPQGNSQLPSGSFYAYFDKENVGNFFVVVVELFLLVTKFRSSQLLRDSTLIVT